MEKVNWKEFRCFVFFLFCAVLIFTGCGRQNSTGAAGAAPEEKGPVYIIQELGSDARTEVILRIVHGVYPDLEMEFIDVPSRGEYQTKIRLMCQAKQDVDLIWDGGMVNIDWISNGFIAQLDDFAADWDDYKTLSDNAKNTILAYDGHVWGIPHGSYQRILFYRTDWLKQAGYDHPPATWEELITMSKRIHALNPDRWGYSFRGGPIGGQYCEMNMVAFLKPEWVDPLFIFVTKEGKSIFEYPEIKEGVEFYLRLYKEASPPDSISWGFSQMVEAFYAGVTAFLVQDSDCIPICQEYMEEGTWATAVLPKGDNGYSFYKQGWGGFNITSHSPRKNKAFQVIKAMGSPEGNMEYAKFNGTYPVQSAAVNDPYFGTGYYKPYGETMLDKTRIGYLEGLWSPLNTPEEIDFMNSLNINEDSIVQSYLTGTSTTAQLITTWGQKYSWVPDSEWVKARAASFKENL
jgi:multiple sugar transport system substrate-binding protein